MKTMITHSIVSEDENWVYGKTFHDKGYFGDWVRYKKSGKPPTPEELQSIESARIEKAHQYRLANPYVPTKEYEDAIKRWPLKQ
jgi:hypothetical protein